MIKEFSIVGSLMVLLVMLLLEHYQQQSVIEKKINCKLNLSFYYQNTLRYLNNHNGFLPKNRNPNAHDYWLDEKKTPPEPYWYARFFGDDVTGLRLCENSLVNKQSQNNISYQLNLNFDGKNISDFSNPQTTIFMVDSEKSFDAYKAYWDLYFSQPEELKPTHQVIDSLNHDDVLNRHRQGKVMISLFDGHIVEVEIETLKPKILDERFLFE